MPSRESSMKLVHLGMTLLLVGACTGAAPCTGEGCTPEVDAGTDQDAGAAGGAGGGTSGGGSAGGTSGGSTAGGASAGGASGGTAGGASAGGTPGGGNAGGASGGTAGGASAGGTSGGGNAGGASGGTAGGASAGGSSGGGTVGPTDGGYPAWRRGLTVNQWAEIQGTAGAAGAAVDAWGALAENKATAELYIAASGGHSDSSDNRVVSISLMSDTPTWTLRRASSTNVVTDVLYYPDGLPTSRHLYHHLHYLAGLNAVLLGGCRYGYGGGTPTGPGMDAFDLTTNQWLPRNTLADITPFQGYVVEIAADGSAWTSAGLRFVPSTNTWSRPGTGSLGRFPHATAPSRNIIFSLQYGDGQGYDLNLGVVARSLNTTTGNSTNITFTANAALTEFITAQPTYAGMDYDADNDRFLFYYGGERGKVYVITPNSTSTWTMSVLPTTGMPAATPTSGSGINKRFRYLPTLGGFVLQPRRDANLFFLPTR